LPQFPFGDEEQEPTPKAVALGEILRALKISCKLHLPWFFLA